MKYIDSEEFQKNVSFSEFLPFLKKAFADLSFQVPKRMHLNVGANNISLVMPCWNEKYYGIKQVLVAPQNKFINLPTIQGKYDLYDAVNGKHLISLDAKALTNFRTAATSLLATSFFLDDINRVIIMGAGEVATSLAEGYCELFDPEIYIWNRNSSKAEILTDIFPSNIKVLEDPKSFVSKVDVISCATHSIEPILLGDWVSNDVHVDLIGSYKPDMREVDDIMIKKGQIYIDDWPACEESGDLAIPLECGIIKKSDIRGTLFELCRDEVQPIKHGITIFKSVGNAIEDLAAAIYVYGRL